MSLCKPVVEALGDLIWVELSRSHRFHSTLHIMSELILHLSSLAFMMNACVQFVLSSHSLSWSVPFQILSVFLMSWLTDTLFWVVLLVSCLLGFNSGTVYGIIILFILFFINHLVCKLNKPMVKQAYYRPKGFQEVEAAKFLDSHPWRW